MDAGLIEGAVMHFNFKLFSAALFVFCGNMQVLTAAPQNRPCDLPSDLRGVLTKKFPGTRVVELPDLEDDDKALFLKEHRDACPGLVNVDFYGDGKPTFALALTTKTYRTELVVAHKADSAWNTSVLEPWTDGSVPVVWSEKPGDYTDVYAEKKIHATRPTIVFCGYESWAVLYAWTGTRVAKIWLAD